MDFNYSLNDYSLLNDSSINILLSSFILENNLHVHSFYFNLLTEENDLDDSKEDLNLNYNG